MCKKRRLVFENYTDSLFNNKIILKSLQRFKSDHHEVYTEDVNKIALKSNDDMIVQTFDVVTTYPHGTNSFRVCESEMMIMTDLLKIMTRSCYNLNKDKNEL